GPRGAPPRRRAGDDGVSAVAGRDTSHRRLLRQVLRLPRGDGRRRADLAGDRRRAQQRRVGLLLPPRGHGDVLPRPGARAPSAGERAHDRGAGNLRRGGAAHGPSAELVAGPGDVVDRSRGPVARRGYRWRRRRRCAVDDRVGAATSLSPSTSTSPPTSTSTLRTTSFYRRGRSATRVAASRYFLIFPWMYSLALPRHSMPGSLPSKIALPPWKRRPPSMVTTRYLPFTVAASPDQVTLIPCLFVKYSPMAVRRSLASATLMLPRGCSIRRFAMGSLLPVYATRSAFSARLRSL